MLEYDYQFKGILYEILFNGTDSTDRTGVGVRKIFDANIDAELEEEDGRYTIPILTLRKSFPRPFWTELFWMLSGSTDANVLKEKNIHIWDVHSSKEFHEKRGLSHLPEGSIGDGYGKQFRDFGGKDQLMDVLTGLIEDPTSRRHYISLWNPVDADNMCLLPCHTTYNFCVLGNTLNLKFFQRSSDWLVAGNANFMFASFFLIWVAKKLGFKVGRVAHSITDCHIYSNHMEAANLIAETQPIEHEASFVMPDSGIDISTVDALRENLDKEIQWMLQDSTWEMVKESLDYQHHSAIPREMLPMSM